MNIEHRTLNSEVILADNSFKSIALQCSRMNVQCSKFFPFSHYVVAKLFQAILAIFFAVLVQGYYLHAQPLQNIYSGLDQATSLYVTPNVIYVVEQGKDRLLKLDHSGKLLDTIGGKGSGNYQFSKPVDVDATNGLKVFVTDYNNRRVQVFDRRGQYLSSISGQNNFGEKVRYNPTQIAVNQLGEIFFVDENRHYIRRFGLDANLLDEFRIPSEVKQVDDLVITPQEMLILDKKSATIHRLSLNGAYIGFYPAEGVKAIFVKEGVRFTAYTDKIEIENARKERTIYKLGKAIEPVDMFYSGQNAYILTAASLYKITVVIK